MNSDLPRYSAFRLNKVLQLQDDTGHTQRHAINITLLDMGHVCTIPQKTKLFSSTIRKCAKEMCKAAQDQRKKILELNLSEVHVFQKISM